MSQKLESPLITAWYAVMDDVLIHSVKSGYSVTSYVCNRMTDEIVAAVETINRQQAQIEKLHASLKELES